MRYFRTDLPEYLAAQQVLRAERLQNERARIWDWLELLPKPNCENVPAQEQAKFFYHCNSGDVSLNLLSNLQGRLEILKADRDLMERRIADLRRTYDDLVARQSGTGPVADQAELTLLNDTLDILEKTQVRMDLMESMSELLATRTDIPPIQSISFITVGEGAKLWSTGRDDAEFLGTVNGANETAIKIETRSEMARNIIIIHPLLGLGFTSQQDLNAE